MSLITLKKKYASEIESLTPEQIKAFDTFFNFTLFGSANAKIDLAIFDYSFNAFVNRILDKEICEKNELEKIDTSSAKDEILTDLLENGYSTDRYVLSEEKVSNLRNEILNLKFRSKSETISMIGNDIVRKSNALAEIPEVGVDTYWIESQNDLIQCESVRELVMDKQILTTVARYLGCPPILAQISSWISIPTLNTKNNLNVNAQMFHQDKEFTKFIKVFVYLNNVDQENGAHWYIEGSHIDDLNKKGIPFSSRISDTDILSYYNKDQIKMASGKSGTVIFGDTSAVHKGGRVKKGHRIMLQLEFCSSLLESPVPKFAKCTELGNMIEDKNYLHHRLLDNFSDDIFYKRDEVLTSDYNHKFTIRRFIKKAYFYFIRKMMP